MQVISDTSDLMVVSEAEDGLELMDQIRKMDVDIVLLDVDMPNKNGWEAIIQLQVEYPKIPVIMLSGFSEDDYAVQFYKAGASGYLNKTHALKEIVGAIRKVMQGGKYISPNMAEKLVADLGQNAEKQPHETLSPREFQILFMIASGKSVKDISEELSLSVPTISSYRARMLEKMDLESNAQVTTYAYRHGLLK